MSPVLDLARDIVAETRLSMRSFAESAMVRTDWISFWRELPRFIGPAVVVFTAVFAIVAIVTFFLVPFAGFAACIPWFLSMYSWSFD